MRAIQQELQNNGRYTQGTVDGQFGAATEGSVKRFQRDSSLVVDGIVGPATGKALFIRRILATELDHGIPGNYLCGMARHESLYDPVATGWRDPRDRGLVQFNSRWHPEITDEIAFDPPQVLEYAAETLKERARNFRATCPRRAWRCAVAAHNNPALAKKACDDGFENITDVDERDRIRRYVASIQLGC